MGTSMLIANLLSAAAVLVFGPLTIALLTLAFAGRRVLTRACCTTCNAELTQATASRRDRCDKCNADLSGPRAIRPWRRRIAWKPLLAGLLSLGIAAGLVVAGQALVFRSLIGTGPSTPLTTLIAAAYAAMSPWSPESTELERRVRSGILTPSELREELKRTLQTGTLARSQAADRVLALALADGVIDETIAQELLASPFLTTPLSRLNPNSGDRVTVGFTHSMGLDGAPVVVRGIVRGMRVDNVDRTPFEPLGIGPMNTQTVLIDPAARQVEVTMDLILVTPLDAARHLDFSGALRPVEQWPEALATRRVTLVLPAQ